MKFKTTYNRNFLFFPPETEKGLNCGFQDVKPEQSNNGSFMFEYMQIVQGIWY